MPKWISKNQLEKSLAKAEEALNVIGYIPMISKLSAAVRSFGGILQLLIGLCFVIVYFFTLKFSNSRKIERFFHFKTSLAHVLHGVCNIIRAKIEAVPFLSLVVCLPYDRILKKRFKYAIESRPDIEAEAEEIII